MSEKQLSDVIVRPGTARRTLWSIPGVGLVDLTGNEVEASFRNVSHARIHELRDLGFEVEVTNGDDPLELAKAAAPKAAVAVTETAPPPARSFAVHDTALDTEPAPHDDGA